MVPGGGGPGSFAEANAFGSNQIIINHGRNVTLSETHVFSPNTVNQISGGYNRIFDYISSQGTGTCTAAIIGIPGANLDCNAANVCAPQGISCGLTSTQFDGGFWALGDRGFAPFIGGTNVFALNDSLDMIRGKHDIKVGLGIRANQMNTRTEGFQDGYWVVTGLWTGNPESDFLLGLPSLAIHDQTFDGSTIGRRWKTFRPFVQDDWRVTPNLTVNLGLAWNLTSPISEVANRQADFNPANGTFLIAGNTPSAPTTENGSASITIRVRSNPASASPGNPVAATAWSSAPDTPSSMTGHGVRARRACGRTRLITLSRIVSPLAATALSRRLLAQVSRATRRPQLACLMVFKSSPDHPIRPTLPERFRLKT